MRFYQQKIIHLTNADVHVHFANNRGRGTNNVTLTVVPTGTERQGLTRGYPAALILHRVQVSGWRGAFHVPAHIIEQYGGVIS